MRSTTFVLSLGGLGLLVAGGACGKVPGQPDATPPMIDAVPPPDADPHGPITINVLDIRGNGAPEANVPVVVINPDGTVVGDTTSDSTGKATVQGVLPGATVSAVWLSGTSYTLATVYEVKPNDTITMGFTQRDNTANGTFPVTFPSIANATSYTVYGPCGSVAGSPGQTVNIPFYKNCKPDTFDVYVIASSASGPFAYAQKLGVKQTDGSVAIPNSYLFSQNFTASFSNLDAAITNVSVDRYSGNANGYDRNTSGTPANGTLSLNVSPNFAAGTKALVQTNYTRGKTSQQIVSQRIAPDATSYAVDAAATLLPWLDAVAFDPATQKFSQTLTGTSPYDMLVTEVVYKRTVGTATTNFVWITFAPDTTTTTLPTIPSHLGDVNPKMTDTIQNKIEFLVDSSAVTGWDQVRPTAFDLIDGVFGNGQSTADTVRASLAFGM